MSARGVGRMRRGALLALAVIVGALALTWWLRGVMEPSAVAAQPVAPATEGREVQVTLVETEDQLERVDVPRSERASLEPVDPDSDSLPGLASVSVRVLGLAPGERATVEARVYGENEDAGDRELRETDEHGEVSLALRPGQLRLGAWTKSRISPTARQKIAAQAVTIELQLEAAALVSGRVTDARSGTAIAGARIALPTECEHLSVLSDSEGRYTILLLADGGFRSLHCNALGYAFERTSAAVDPDGRVRIQAQGPMQATSAETIASAQRSINFVLWPERTIAGEVHGASRPLAGALIEASAYVWTGSGLASPDEATATAGASGAFELSGLRPDVGHVLTIRHPGYARTLLLVPAAHEPRQQLGVVRLAAESSLELRVVDGAGAAVEGAVLVLQLPLPLAPGTSAASKAEFPRDPGFEHERKRTERTGPDGRATFPALAPGRYTVVLRGHPAEVCAEPIEVGAGEVRRVLIELPAVAPITGRVLDVSGPIAGARVELNRMGGRYTLSDAQGRFSFAGLIEGTSYHLQAEWTDDQARERDTDAIEAQPGAAIELRAR